MPTKAIRKRLSFRMMIRISPEQRTQLRAEAKRRGIKSISRVVRDWMVERLETAKGAK